MRRFILISLFAIMMTLAFGESPHGVQFNKKCDICHTTNNWIKIKPYGFNHDSTSFPLAGQHQAVECRKCHVDLVFSNAKTTCNSCHKDVHQQTVGLDCQRCHTQNSWFVKNIKDIHRKSKFPLAGNHAQLDCNECHKSASLLRYDPMKSDCIDCHAKNYNATTNPSHIQSKFPTDCTLCHSQNTWFSATFNHNNTNFPLKGGHVGVECVKCHATGYVGTSTKCVSCHQAKYNATTNPNHSTAKFPTTCETCHNTNAWQPSTFNHTTGTSFPLTGAHIGVTCAACHTNGYAGIPTTCVSCHQTKFNATTNPNHISAKFPTTCETCHNTNAWQPSTFNHTTNTSFPLTGAHIGVTCAACHTKGYAGIPTTCVSCHQAKYIATTNPNHSTAKFPTTCETCHKTNAWTPSTFNHNTTTSFPLNGAHVGLACNLCHINNFNPIPTTCVSCHQTKFNATTNPNHISAKFPTTCETCHNTNAWQPSTFNHTTNTSFPLTGAHIGVTCAACHTNGYAGIPTTCVSCHQAKYNSTTNPNHSTAKFPTTCETCHKTNAWTPSTFNHNTTTSFPLSGAHVGLACNLCHINNFNPIPTTCVSCHQTKFNSTTNPNHISAKFPTTCETCHNTNAWQPSTFNHTTSTSFPLTGAHIGVTCAACHKNGYAGIPTTCVSCHQTNYNAATNPNHKASATVFTTNCISCHNVNAWSPAPLFNHTSFFPISSGRHSGINCATCHTNSSNYTVFTCVTSSCHGNAHNQNQGSNGCYTCHRTGRAG